VTVIPPDYDDDPERFLSNALWPHDEVHPYVARRLAAAGVRRVLDVGGGHTLADPVAAAAFLCSHVMSEESAREAAQTLELPLTLTMRGCVVYATKGTSR